MTQPRPPAPKRVTVTGPRTKASRRPVRYAVSQDVDQQTELGEVYVRSLMRDLLRAGLFVIVLVGGGLAALPVAFRLWPSLRTVEVLGFELPWLIMAVLVYPVVVFAGWRYMRRADRIERDFANLVERS
jgi:hypothetical protein